MGRGGAPAREISFVSLVAYGPKVFDSALTMGGLQLLKPGRAVPNTGHKEKWGSVLGDRGAGKACFISKQG